MRAGSSFWGVVVVLAAAMVATAPLTASCDDVTEVETEKWPIGQLDGLNQGMAASRDYYWEGDGDGSAPELVVFYTDPPDGLSRTQALNKEMAAGMYYQGSYQDLGMENSSGAISCPNPRQVDVAMVRSSQYQGQRMAVVAGLCSGAAEIAQVLINMEPGGEGGLNVSAEWSRPDVQFDSTSQPDSISVAASNSFDLEPLEEMSACTGGSSIECAKGTGGVLNTVIRLGGNRFGSNIHHTYDSNGDIHMVGVDADGKLGYARFPRGSTQADAGSVTELGQASQNQSWNWNQIAAGPDGTMYVSTFNPLEGDLYVFYKAADSPNHWYYFALSSSGGPMGMYNSMAVDSLTGNAILTFADSEGHTRIMIVSPDGRRQTTTFDPSYGQPHSTATTAGNGFGSSLWINGLGDTGVFQFGARFDF